MKHSILIVLVVAAACGTEARSAASDSSAASAATARDSSAGTVARIDTANYPVVRGLYLNRFAAQSPRKLKRLLEIADSTEINAFVIDMKDEFGLNYVSPKPLHRKNSGGGSRGLVRDVRALVDSVKAHGLLPIARIVAFKDPVAAEANPAWTIRKPDGSVWIDKEGHTWVNAHNREVQEYNLAVAEELIELGFDEIQWDYIRFPEPYPSLPKQVFPGATVSNPDALADFLRRAGERLGKRGVRNTADIFGLVTTVRGPLEVGQHWEKLSKVTDVLLPMVYPSHYPRGAFGIARPNAEPYEIVKRAISAARTRDSTLGITRAEHVRPWIQAFSIGKPDYGPEQIAAQKKAIYDSGYNGWIFWHPGSQYEIFLPALEKEKPCRFYTPATDSLPIKGLCA